MTQPTGEPVIVTMAEREWEAWPDELVVQRGGILWKTLLSADVTRSNGLTLGIAVLPPGECLHEHRHEPTELYLILEGSGEVTIDGEARPVGPETVVFIAGNARHSCRNTGTTELRFAYVFAADSFDDVEYRFEH